MARPVVIESNVICFICRNTGLEEIDDPFGLIHEKMVWYCECPAGELLTQQHKERLQERRVQHEGSE